MKNLHGFYAGCFGVVTLACVVTFFFSLFDFSIPRQVTGISALAGLFFGFAFYASAEAWDNED